MRPARGAARAGRFAWAAAFSGRVLLAAALALPLGGCALLATPPQTRALLEAPPADLPPRAERADTPFFPQTEYECGPAALATALGAAGIAVRPEALTDQVYLPQRRGSLQLEMLATARRRGALAVRLPGTLDALLHELAAGRPVVLLQNLSLPIAPRWHYAVAIGYDLPRRELLLRSGTTERQVLGLATFEHTWARSGHWSFVVVPPGELPASASEDEMTAAAVAFERVATPDAARRAYEAALSRWPGSLTLAVGVGNARYAAGDVDGAATAFEAAARRHDSAAAWINLAELRLQQGRRDEAEAAARRAVARGAAEPAFAEAAQATLGKVLAAPR
jgi:tetratricopeptide (TPR) repeat protein